MPLLCGALNWRIPRLRPSEAPEDLQSFRRLQNEKDNSTYVDGRYRDGRAAHDYPFREFRMSDRDQNQSDEQGVVHEDC
jgi:hypothetical protein